MGLEYLGGMATSGESSQRDFASAFQLLPGVSPHTPDWGGRFVREMPLLEPPYFGFNLADVRRENYDAIYENIRQQAEGAAALFGGRLHLFSVTDYEEIRRVAFIFYFETFPDAETVNAMLGLPVPEQSDEAIPFPNIWTGSDLWTEFVTLAEGYTWWVTPAQPAGEMRAEQAPA